MNKHEWQIAIEQNLKQLIQQAREYPPGMLYGALSSTVLFPILSSVSQGDYATVVTVGGLLTVDDTNLIAKSIGQWKDFDSDELAIELTEKAQMDPHWRHVFDILLQKFNVLEQLYKSGDEAAVDWFIENLRIELQDLGNYASHKHFFEPSIGTIIQPVLASKRGVAAGNDIKDSVVTTGDNNSITYVITQYLLQTKQAVEPKLLQQQIANYLKWCIDRYGRIELRGIQREGQQVMQLDLDTVYVPLEANFYGELQQTAVELNRILSLGNRLTITGGPGSGKTTVLRHVIWALAKAILQGSVTTAQHKIGLKDFLLEKITKEISEARQSDDFFQQRVHSLATRVQSLLKEQERQQAEEKKQKSASKVKHSVDAKTEQQIREISAEYQRALQNLRVAVERAYEHTQMRFSIEHLVNARLADLLQLIETASQTPRWYEIPLYTQFPTVLSEIYADILHEEATIPLPIFVPLSAYAAYLQRLEGKATAQERTLAYFISLYQIERQTSFDLSVDFFSTLVRAGFGVMLLLDGLDEVSTESERVQIVQAIQDLAASREWLNVVITCRTIAYKDRTVLAGFQEVRVKPLEDRHIKLLIWQAYASIYPNNRPEHVQRYRDLWHSVQLLEEQRRKGLGPNTLRLITSPLLVSMLIIVHYSERRLPEQRAELYMKAAEVMLLPKYAPDQEVAERIGKAVGGSRELQLELVQYLAFAMHSRGEVQGREISENDLRTILSEHPSHKNLLERFLELTRSRGTLLEERNSIYRFIHLSFQEFLVARYLAEVIRDIERIVQFLEKGPILDSWWHESILLLVGYLNITSPLIAQELIARLVRLKVDASSNGAEASSEVLLAGAVVGATAFLELHSSNAEMGQAIAQKTIELIKVGGQRLSLRLTAGNNLNQLGDLRFNPAYWYLPHDHMLGFVEIPAGKFIFGQYDQRHQTEVELPLYYIARYPVTVAQFCMFLDDTNFDTSGMHGLKDPPNYPIRGLTWHHTIAYCAWIEKQLLTLDATVSPIVALLQTHKSWRLILPSEFEWEKAARGTDGRQYPWGNNPQPDLANCQEAGVGFTSTVGCFSRGQSVFQVEEMIGNVWEWTRSIYTHDPHSTNLPMSMKYEILKTDYPRVLRGGSFLDPIATINCATRLQHSDPHIREKSYGFRIAIVPVVDT